MGIYLKGLELYPARVHCEGGFYQADFIDIPHCRAYGSSAIEAEVAAAEVLQQHAQMLGRYGRHLPLPSIPAREHRLPDSYVAFIPAPAL
ncbi:type II toxin-antitoxin system HicB family antitoxin [Rhizorhabdus sp. FW153]|uniref:type II toxin-antitoxin system HicB family antitoxin n=1 Tax=Rhizorhabdus sp. FW153 TaxID=3400216 RepID=UPI003CE72666